MEPILAIHSQAQVMSETITVNTFGHINHFVIRMKNKIQYFGEKSNLHGVRHMFSMSNVPRFKRIFWLGILIACGVGAAGILRAAMSLYSSGAVSYSVETDYLDWDTPFPALTICEQLDSDRVKSYLSKNKMPATLTTFFKEVTFWNVKYCKACNSCNMNVTCVENIQELVNNFRLGCAQLLTECWWNQKQFSCCDRFRPIKTEYGVCFVFNSRLVGNSSVKTANRKIGLPSLMFSAIEPIFIRVHSPDEVVSVGLENILGRSALLPLVTDFDLILKAEETISASSVQSISTDIRGCLYKNEHPAFATLWPFESYTYGGCVWYCRTVAQAEMCNCTHHFMPQLGNYPVCDISGLACLNKHKDSLTQPVCECPMGCEEILYKVVHVFYNRHSGKLPEELVTRGTRGRVQLAQLPALRVRRLAIKDKLALVVDIGGVIGVFFGASLLSVLEIFYLLCIRRP